MSEELTLRQKVFRVQQELIAPKSQKNSFGGYSYRSCEDIMEAAKPLCEKYGLILLLSDSVDFIEGRHYVKSQALLMDVNDGATYSNIAFARESDTKKGMDAAQVTGAASSYARKYALNGLLMIDDCKDADATNRHDKPVPPALPFVDITKLKTDDGKKYIGGFATADAAIAKIRETRTVDDAAQFAISQLWYDNHGNVE
jgi:hypothetical protein